MLTFYAAVLLLCLVLVTISGVTCSGNALDRVVFLNVTTALGMMLIVLYAFIKLADYLLDLALVYACINFISAVAFAKFFDDSFDL